jgi:hypothetical protein
MDPCRISRQAVSVSTSSEASVKLDALSRRAASCQVRLQDEEEERAVYASFVNDLDQSNDCSIIPPMRQTQIFAPLSSVLLCPALVLDLSVRSIVSPFVFLMPTAGAVFVLDRDALP